jgi:hypothetical protein
MPVVEHQCHRMADVLAYVLVQCYLAMFFIFKQHRLQLQQRLPESPFQRGTMNAASGAQSYVNVVGCFFCPKVR